MQVDFEKRDYVNLAVIIICLTIFVIAALVSSHTQCETVKEQSVTIKKQSQIIDSLTLKLEERK